MKVILACVAFGLSVAGANACNYQRSAKVDSTVVASVTSAEPTAMSVPVTPAQPVDAEKQPQPAVTIAE